jgi:hypothetical protein
MTLSPAPSPSYRHPPFVNDIRGWDDFFLNSPRSTPSDRRNFGSDFLVPPKFHGQKQPTLASTPKIFLFCKSSPCILASSRKTLETSLFYATHTTNFHINGNEMTQPIYHQRKDNRGERVIPPPAPMEPPYTQGAGASDRTRLLAESGSKNCTNKGGEGTSLRHRKEGWRHPSRGRRCPLLQTDTRGVSHRSNPPVRRSGKLRLGFGQQLGVRSLGGPEEYRRIDRGQHNKENSCRGSGHSHRCIAPPPLFLCTLKACPPSNLTHGIFTACTPTVLATWSPERTPLRMR